ncbi:MAG: LysR family transcriptional regulator [Caulobacterales bacterium]|nr:LysR family transcriptional regulator [Caulobacterales bacterium]
MILRGWRYFLKVAETGNLTRAAAQLHMTQPALSRHLKQLEEEMGVELLMRHGRGVRLTEAGALFVEQARDILARADTLADILHAREVRPSGQLAIGMPLSWSSLITTPLIVAYRKKYPSVTLRLLEGTTDSLRQGLKRREIQAAVVTMVERDPEVELRHLVSDGAYFIGPPDSTVVKDGQLDLKALIGQPLVLLSHTTNVRRELERVLAQARLSTDMVLEVNTLSLLNFVEQGVGCSVLPACAVAGFNRGRHLKVSLIDGFRSDWALASLRGHPGTAALKAFEDMMNDIIADLIERGDWPSARIAGGA